MYNDAQKRRFIEDVLPNPGTRANAEYVFDVIAPFEEAWGADICTRTAEEIEPALKKISGLRLHTNVERRTYITRYMKWCLAQGIPGATDSYNSFTLKSMNRMADSTIPNPVKLQEYLNKLFQPEEDRTIDIVYRCMYWMAYAGMFEEDIYSVTSSDVDLIAKKIRYNGDEYELYGEGIAALEIAATSDTFIYDSPRYGADRNNKERSRVDGDLLLRGFKAIPKVDSMRVILSRRMKKALDSGIIDKRLSYDRTRISGIFFRAKQREISGYPPQFDDVAAAYVSRIEFDDELTMIKRRKQIASEYMRDYRRWKEAWDL